jgi:hypothetical protein
VAKSSASLQWRYLLRLTDALPLTELTEFTNDLLKQLPTQRGLVMGRWLLVPVGAAALLYWNGRLVLATSTGIAVMLLIYLMHDWKPNLPTAEIRKLIEGWNQPLALAIVGGGAACLSTYLAASIWANSDSAWIALGSLLQGSGTLAVLLLLAWQILHRQTQHDRVYYHQTLADLTHADPLRRLIAVRHLTSTVPDLSHQPAQQQELADYFRLLLHREPEPIVQEAVLVGLERLDRVRSLKPASQPLVQPPLQPQGISRRRSPLRATVLKQPARKASQPLF